MNNYKCKKCAREFDSKEYDFTNDKFRCILHCEKDRWNSDKEKIRFFWKRVREIIQKEKEVAYSSGESIDFSYTLFPKFENSFIDTVPDGYGIENIVDWSDNFCNSDISDNLDANNIVNVSLNFKNAVFLDNVNFSDYKFDYEVSFSGTYFKGECLFKNTFFDSVSFDNAVFKNPVRFDNIRFTNDYKNQFDIFFKNTIFSKVHFNGGSYLHGIGFDDKTKIEFLKIENIGLENLYIVGDIVNITIDSKGKTLSQLKIENNCLENLSILGTIIETDFLLYQHHKLKTLNFKESVFKKKVKIQYQKIVKANFYNTKFEDLADFYQTIFENINFEKTDFKDISVFSEVRFLCNVDFKYTKFLGKAIFRDMVITGALNLRDSIFDAEANFLGVTSDDKPLKERKLLDIKVANRETARVIKNLFDNSSNIIEANKFITSPLVKTT